MVVIGDAGEACQDFDARYTFGEMEQITRFDDSPARVRALAIEKMLMISPHVNGYVDDGIQMYGYDYGLKVVKKSNLDTMKVMEKLSFQPVCAPVLGGDSSMYAINGARANRRPCTSGHFEFDGECTNGENLPGNQESTWALMLACCLQSAMDLLTEEDGMNFQLPLKYISV